MTREDLGKPLLFEMGPGAIEFSSVCGPNQNRAPKFAGWLDVKLRVYERNRES
jgi:hypothetical protein